ncbi:hypothetical protein E4U35_000246, partial [Claviceps purpurea]
MAESVLSSHGQGSAPDVPITERETPPTRPLKESLPKHVRKFVGEISTEWDQYSENIDPNSASNIDLNNRLVWAYDYYVSEEMDGFELEQMFAEDFMEWSYETWNKASGK